MTGVALLTLLVVALVFFATVALFLLQHKPKRIGGDGIRYAVAASLSADEQRKSAEALSDINERIMRLLESLRKRYSISPDPRDDLPRFECPSGAKSCDEYAKRMNGFVSQVVRLLTLYQADNLEEHLPALADKETSSTINKGARIKICLRDKTKHRRIYDMDTLMFVTVHELAHVACDERVFGDSHTEKFWDIFRFLLLECHRINLFEIRNYNVEHKDYSGIIIRYSPIHNAAGGIRWFETDLLPSKPLKSVKGGYHP